MFLKVLLLSYFFAFSDYACAADDMVGLPVTVRFYQKYVPKYLKPDEIAKLRTKGSYREQDLRLPGNSTLKTLHDSIQEMFKDPEKTVRMRDHYRMYDPTKKSLKDVPLEKMISEVLVNYGSKYSVNILLEPTSKQKTEEETTARILELLRNAKEGGANVGKIIKKISKTAAHDFTD